MNISRSTPQSHAGQSLTPKQRQFFERLLESFRREGVPPTVRELQESCGFKSPRSVLQFLDVLAAAGYIERRDGARNIRVLRLPEPESGADRTDTARVPLVGRIAAGLPLLAEQNVEDYIPVSRRLARPPHEYFLLRVVGNSMDQAGISDGDLVLVRKQLIAQDGDRVVALIDGEATVKVLRRAGDAILLQPKSSDPSHQPIVLGADFMIQGVVQAAIKDRP